MLARPVKNDYNMGEYYFRRENAQAAFIPEEIAIEIGFQKERKALSWIENVLREEKKT